MATRQPDLMATRHRPNQTTTHHPARMQFIHTNTQKHCVKRPLAVSSPLAISSPNSSSQPHKWQTTNTVISCGRWKREARRRPTSLTPQIINPRHFAFPTTRVISPKRTAATTPRVISRRRIVSLTPRVIGAKDKPKARAAGAAAATVRRPVPRIFVKTRVVTSAPVCSHCNGQIGPQECFIDVTAAAASNQSANKRLATFHTTCLFCETCREFIHHGSEKYVVVNQKLFHRNCILSTCSRCNLKVEPGHKFYHHDGDYFHANCLACERCGKPIGNSNDTLAKSGGKIYHTNCMHCNACSGRLSGRYEIHPVFPFTFTCDSCCYKLPKCVACERRSAVRWTRPADRRVFHTLRIDELPHTGVYGGVSAKDLPHIQSRASPLDALTVCGRCVSLGAVALAPMGYAAASATLDLIKALGFHFTASMLAEQQQAQTLAKKSELAFGVRSLTRLPMAFDFTLQGFPIALIGVASHPSLSSLVTTIDGKNKVNIPGTKRKSGEHRASDGSLMLGHCHTSLFRVAETSVELEEARVSPIPRLLPRVGMMKSATKRSGIIQKLHSIVKRSSTRILLNWTETGVCEKHRLVDAITMTYRLPYIMFVAALGQQQKFLHVHHSVAIG
eukprot:GHVT01047493.1.p1 GENE.GHVT01047493.1~~GHVT01047493.1.p1  ORF type:complete len:617 (-),score=36.40 GHVT01047493.1:2587-4437(-)